ncbi:thiamine-binding protein [Bacillus sp. SB49]|uniref:YkoF family thiamine/hydroxymethylpyrimidine-binding protein n=1 Tax=Bacillus sp. SB49 TaxID=1071080 RepID=UPI00041834BE|nr:YkoF family thiamine/hydroxymethylpyrimidine-binding protein [Bacillus sp. SB49]QHT46975.1 thiamine-binding protein [Bacillus sp. SB49]
MTQVCGNSKIAGCSFSVHPMCNDFQDMIMTSLQQTDTSKVWMKTDHVTTTVRGRLEHVFDVAKAVFHHTAVTGVHAAFQGTFSIGCPGDSTGDVYLDETSNVMNRNTAAVKQAVAAKFSLYPLGGGKYMETIYEKIERMREQGISVTPDHYSTRLEGDIHDIFHGLENVFKETEAGGSSHTVMTVSISANSPSKKEEEE